MLPGGELLAMTLDICQVSVRVFTFYCFKRSYIGFIWSVMGVGCAFCSWCVHKGWIMMPFVKEFKLTLIGLLCDAFKPTFREQILSLMSPGAVINTLDDLWTSSTVGRSSFLCFCDVLVFAWTARRNVPRMACLIEVDIHPWKSLETTFLSLQTHFLVLK